MTRYVSRARRSEPDLVAQPAGQILGIYAELLHQARVALGVDLVGQLALGLVGVVVVGSDRPVSRPARCR